MNKIMSCRSYLEILKIFTVLLFYYELEDYSWCVYYYATAFLFINYNIILYSMQFHKINHNNIIVN